MNKVAKYILRLLIIVLLNICVLGVVLHTVQVAQTDRTAIFTLSRVGSRGNEVKQIQQKLKSWGYYAGNVDGIFGEQTAAAVKKFQSSNGLTADGVVGPATLSALGISSGGQSSGGGGSINDSDLNLLARLVSAEARGEPFSGQVAVAAVILNRVEHPSFPDSIAGVAYQPGAFTAMTDGQINEAVADSAYRAAKEALNGSDPSGGAIYYYNPDRAINAWIRTRPVITRIGKHLFCS